MTVQELIRLYTKSKAYKNLAARSQQSYGYCLDDIEKKFGKRDILSIRRSDVMEILDDRADKPGYANMIVRVFSILFTFAIDRDLVPFNPASRIKKLKLGSHEKWTPDDVRQIVALNDRRITAAVILAWYTGQREEDVLIMRWSQYKDGRITLIQTKTQTEMTIKVHDDLAAYLDRLRGNEPDNYFIVSGKDRLSGQAFRGYLRRRLDAAGIKKVFHGIRKGVACSLAESGRPTSEIAAILGHKTQRMAEYYSKQANTKILTDNAVKNLVSVTAPVAG